MKTLLILTLLCSTGCTHNKWYKPYCTEESTWKDVAEVKLEVEQSKFEERATVLGPKSTKRLYHYLMAERGYLALTPEQIVVAKSWEEERYLKGRN